MRFLVLTFTLLASAFVLACGSQKASPRDAMAVDIGRLDGKMTGTGGTTSDGTSDATGSGGTTSPVLDAEDAVVAMDVGIDVPAQPDGTMTAEAGAGDARVDASQTQCAVLGGQCWPATMLSPSMGGPGLKVTCPTGSLLANGQPWEVNDEMGLSNSSQAHGCAHLPEFALPALCCFPTLDGAVVDATDIQ